MLSNLFYIPSKPLFIFGDSDLHMKVLPILVRESPAHEYGQGWIEYFYIDTRIPWW